MKSALVQEHGKSIEDFRAYDNSILDIKSRIELVNSLLYDENGNLEEYISTYFSNYYKSNLGSDDNLSNKDKMCRTLEILGTYILSAKDVVSNRKVDYRFWKSQREFNDYKASEEKTFSSLEANYCNGEDKDIEFYDVISNQMGKEFDNDNIIEETQIYDDDINNIEGVGRLQDAIDELSDNDIVNTVSDVAESILNSCDNLSHGERKKLNYIKKNAKRYIDSYKKSLKENQVVIKESVKSPITAKTGFLVNGNKNEYDVIADVGYSDVAINRKLLEMLSDYDIYTDLGLILFEFEQLCERVKMNKSDRIVLDCLKKGYDQNEISKETNMSRQNVNRSIKSIAEKVAKYYSKYADVRTIAK